MLIIFQVINHRHVHERRKTPALAQMKSLSKPHTDVDKDEVVAESEVEREER